MNHFSKSLPVLVVCLAVCSCSAGTTKASEAHEPSARVGVEPAPRTLPADPATTKLAIQSVTFVSNAPIVAPQYWHGESLIVRSSLDTTQEIIDGGKTTTTNGKISQAQFDALTSALLAADVTHAQSQGAGPRPGSSMVHVTVVTNQGTYDVAGASPAELPPGFEAIFKQAKQLAPVPPSK